MVRNKYVIILITLLFVLTSVPVYANTTADLYRLYGIDDPPSVQQEQVILDDIIDEWAMTTQKLNSYKMMDTAVLLVELQYMELMQSMDINILAVQTEIEEALVELESSKNGTVTEIIQADVKYRTLENEYSRLLSDRLELTTQLSIVHYVNPNKAPTQAEVDKLGDEVKEQERILEYAKSFVEIGVVGSNKYPIASTKGISSPFGWRLDPIGRVDMQFHSGTDFSAKIGTDVLAQFDGIVEAVKETTTGGKTVVLNHGNNVRTVYIHLDSFMVEKGDIVKQYQPIAKSGNTGSRTTGPHLHFGLFIGGTAYDASRLYK